MREPVINAYRVFSSASGLLNQNYHFNESCKWFIGTLKCGVGNKNVWLSHFEGSGGSWPSVVASPSSVIQAILSIPSVAMVTFLAFRFVASEL